MKADNKPPLIFKIRSKSMPLISPLLIQRSQFKSNKKKIQEDINSQAKRSYNIIDIEALKDREIQEINAKIKMIAERNLKKL